MAEITITLASQEIDINDVLEIQTSERSTSFPYPTETQPHTASVVLSDAAGFFGPDNPNNFFRQNMQNPNGARCPVEIVADGTVLFAGEVDDLRQSVDGATVTLRCIDNSRQIRIEALENFGLQKAWKLIQDTEFSASDNGVYPLTLGVAPLSEGSVTVSKALGEELNIVPEIKNAGILDADNIEITERAVISEGGAIDAVPGGAYPQIQAKSPYRYQKAVTLVNAILQYYGLTGGHVEIPERQIEPHAEVLGRVGYETVVGNVGSSNHLSWYGYVTDIIADGDTLYFAYSVNRGSVYFSSVEAYNRATDTWSTLYRHGTAGTEIWGLAKIGDTLIVLLTDSDNRANTETPTEGSYDSNTNSSVYLATLDVTANTPALTTLVAAGDTYCPQLAHFYQIGTRTALVAGAAPTFEAVALPDTRRRLISAGSNLYYGYAKNGRAGVARVAIGGTAVSLMDFASDSRNHAGFGYCFNGSQLILVTTFFDGVQSTLKAVRRT